MGKLIRATALALMLGASAYAAQGSGNAEIAVKGVMQEDKNGMFIFANGQYYDLVFAADNSADMKKFYSSLGGDMVQVKGSLIVEKDKDGKTHLAIAANDVARMRGERAAEVKVEPRVIEERPVYIEHEHENGINLPFVHINW